MKNLKKLSKFLSLILRHNPEKIGITIQEDGWVPVEELLTKGKIELSDLEEVVATSDKKRFSFSEDKTMIRANQGHSVKVKMNFQEKVPPYILYHGTVRKFCGSIMKEGLKKMNRHHVHLSPDKGTAEKVGSRRGAPVILKIHARKMYVDGFKFYVSENGVWLVDEVPSKYIST